MGWAIGYDHNWQRDIGYGVPCKCDHPGCERDIHRGLAHVCGGEPHGGDVGCGLFFCSAHLWMARGTQCCNRCRRYRAPYKQPKPDVPEWLRWKLRDYSWKQWRDENPLEVRDIRSRLRAYAETQKAG
jgi:hypothetical protein